MSQILIVAHLQLSELDLSVAADYPAHARAALQDCSGAEGVSLWQRPTDPLDALLIYGYQDHAAANAGLELLMKAPMLIERGSERFRPAEVLRMVIEGAHGETVNQIPVSGFLSISRRVANLGFGDELSEEVRRIFEDLELLPGYLGSARGTNDSLPDEVIGLVYWESQDAFQLSIPPTARDYEVGLYRRTA